MMKKSFILPYNEKRRLHYHAYRAQQKDQREVCGVISSDQNSIITLHFLKNYSKKAGNYRISATDVAAVRRGLKQKNIIGLFHSHVVSEAIPGPRDIQNACTAYLQLIYDVCGRVVRLWKIKRIRGRTAAVELPLIVASRKSTTHCL